jgi:hypothetical protein
VRCHVINCLIALDLVQLQNETQDEVAPTNDYELVKCKVFIASIRMILDEKFNRNEAVANTILSVFPFADERKISDEQSWLPQHFSIALAVRDEISEDNLRTILSVDPSAMHRLNKKEAYDKHEQGNEGGREKVCAPRLSLSN